jgi:hypothetical protein
MPTGMAEMEYCEISERFMIKPSKHKETAETHIAIWNGPEWSIRMGFNRPSQGIPDEALNGF